LGLTVLAAVAVSGASVGADPPAEAGPVSQAHRTLTRPSLDERVKRLGRGLNLSEDQQAAVKRILEKRQQDALRLRLDSSMTGEARIDQYRALQVRTVQEISAVLNEEQRKKYNPLAPRDLPQAPQQRSVEDWIKLTTPKD
jgi:hypothetical protein